MTLPISAKMNVAIRKSIGQAYQIVMGGRRVNIKEIAEAMLSAILLHILQNKVPWLLSINKSLKDTLKGSFASKDKAFVGTETYFESLKVIVL